MASSSTVSDIALTGAGNLIKVLPTGTVFFFQFVSPAATNAGGGGGDSAATCTATNKALDAALIALCSLFCVFTCFTDSYTDPATGAKIYGVATAGGLWTPSAGTQPPPDSSRYRIGAGDFVHAFLTLVVFATLALLDPNTVRCFYPGFASGDQRVLLQVLPALVGGFTSVVFVLFPHERHGIGYPSSSDDNDISTTTTTTTSTTPLNPSNPSPTTQV